MMFMLLVKLHTSAVVVSAATSASLHSTSAVFCSYCLVLMFSVVSVTAKPTSIVVSSTSSATAFFLFVLLLMLL